MTVDEIKSELFESKIQLVELDGMGNVLQSDNTIMDIPVGSHVGEAHPFFEGLSQLITSLDSRIHFPCVNLDLGEKPIIADIDLIIEENRLYMVIFDFTEHYQRSHPLVQEKNETAIARNKLSLEMTLLSAKEEFKKKFLANLNHEIRNPLNNLLGFMEVLGESNLNYNQREILKVMQKTGAHLKVLMDDMLDISKIERGALEIKEVPFQLNDLVNSLIKHFELKHNSKNVALHLESLAKIPSRVIGDPMRINQVLFNLMENAFKHTKKGSITLSLDLKEQSENQELLHVEFIVRDTGIGIPSENLSRVFDSYYQIGLNEVQPIGDGIGLKIVKDLVQLMNGDVSVTSTEGEGSCFRVILPLKKSRPTKEKKRKTTKKGSGIIRGKNVLVVENKDVDQMLLMKMFGNLDGYNIEIAQTGEKAIEMLENKRYALVILKSKLPDQSGKELVSQIRSSNMQQVQEIPILVASGNVVKDQQEQLAQAGASAFLPKPYTQTELFRIVKKLT